MSKETVRYSSHRNIDQHWLFAQIKRGFSASAPIQQRDAFQYLTTSFLFADRKVDVSLSQEEIESRLNAICDVLTELKRRDINGKQSYSVDEAYRVFSLVASKWITLHGCLGADGHGRATIQLFPITMWLAGYPEEFKPRQFVDPTTGRFDIQKAKFAIFWLNGHVMDGLRLLAARQQMVQGGFVDDIFLDRRIIYDQDLCKKANLHALSVLTEETKQWACETIASLLDVPRFELESPADFGFSSR